MKERLDRLESRQDRVEDAVDRIERAITDALATWRGLALKQIGTVAVAALGLGGTLIATRAAPAAPTRSAYDISLDECRPLQGAERAACWNRKESPRATAPTR